MNGLIFILITILVTILLYYSFQSFPFSQQSLDNNDNINEVYAILSNEIEHDDSSLVHLSPITITQISITTKTELPQGPYPKVYFLNQTINKCQKMPLTTSTPPPTETETTAEEYFNEGYKQFLSGNYQQALNNFDKALKINPSYAIAYNGKGNALGTLGNYTEAIENFDKALEIDPNFAVAYNSKGLALNDLGRYAEAIKSYDKAIEIDPNFAVAYYNKGLSLESLGRFREAISNYEQASSINPSYKSHQKDYELR